MKTINQAQVAAKSGVSITTVSRVINKSGYVADAIRIRVDEAISELGYQPLKKKRSMPENLIGLILRKTTVNMYFDRLSSALSHAANEAGYQIITLYAPVPENATLQGYAEKLLNSGVCGLIICGFNDDYLSPELRLFLKGCGVPIVFIERTAGSYGFNRVLVDNSLGTYYAAKHLIENGHKHLLYIARKKMASVETSRQEGFLRAIEEAGADQITYIIQQREEYNIQAGYLAMRSALEEDPSISGVAVWFDGYAAGAMQYIYEIGRRVPKDIELIGHDDTLAYMLAPPISSIQMPFDEMACSAIEMIIENRDDPFGAITKTVSLEPRLILRDSVRNNK